LGLRGLEGNMEKDKRRKGFMICPVRNDPAGELSRRFVLALEEQFYSWELFYSWDLHWPHRDTDQEDDTGLRICRDNLEAIKQADRVFVVWDGQSHGCLFDLGMAFALGKPITWLKLPEPTAGKSFANMVRAWENDCDRK
jgi:hypothetical protein